MRTRKKLKRHFDFYPTPKVITPLNGLLFLYFILCYFLVTYGKQKILIKQDYQFNNQDFKIMHRIFASIKSCIGSHLCLYDWNLIKKKNGSNG